MKILQNKILIKSTSILLAILDFISCNRHFDDIQQIEPSSQITDVSVEDIKLSKEQAIAYVGLFGQALENSGKKETETRSSETPKEISYIDFYVENGDTLLFAINYKDERGFCILKADNASFPIIAHSEIGSIDFGKITEENPLMEVINFHKNEVQQNLSGENKIDAEYYEKWKDIGNPDYLYEITPVNTSPENNTKTRARRHSTGKASVYPYTGKDLDTWTQEGNFNDAAPNKACIGCPAIAIGMLLYDCNNRISGRPTITSPCIPYWGATAKKDNNAGKLISEKFKTIADSIPNYNWGKIKDYASGAMPDDIVKGLRKLGFKNASIQDYDFETLYKNLSYKNRGTISEKGIRL